MILTLWLWQNSIALRTCHSTFFTAFSSRPLGYLSNSSRTVWSTNSKTRKSRFLRRKTSIKLTRLSCRNCWKSTKQNSTLKENQLSKIVKNITKTHIIYQTFFFFNCKTKNRIHRFSNYDRPNSYRIQIYTAAQSWRPKSGDFHLLLLKFVHSYNLAYHTDTGRLRDETFFQCKRKGSC